MSINIAKIRRILLVILTIIVCFLVIFAIYANKSRFYSYDTVKYSRITVDEKTDLKDIINRYSDNNTKDKFISELKKVNGLIELTNDKIYGRTIYIPLISN